MAVIEEYSTITAKGQTTVPKAIRQALGVSYGGRIRFRVEDGTVILSASEPPESDPALGPFLALLEADMQLRPHVLVPLTQTLSSHIAAATEGVAVDLDLPIEGDVAL